MKIDANAQAIYNAFQSQQVSASNVAKVNTGPNPAPAAVKGDSVNISDAARAAAAEELSAADPAQDVLRGEAAEAAVSANVDAIQTQDQMYRALMGLTEARKQG